MINRSKVATSRELGPKEFSYLPAADQAVSALLADANPRWGLGWEVVLRKIGFGGTYLVRFFQDDQSDWLFDWWGEPFYISYHLFGGGAFIDPFVSAGVACAGGLNMDNPPTISYTRHPFTEVWDLSGLALSLFPMLTAGLAVDLDGFTVGARMNYIPFQSPIPATEIAAYPVGQFQIVAYVGVTLGRR